MSGFPSLDRYGYQINQQLGCNREGGRITWKSTSLTDQNTVVIKQFCFAKADSSWSGYKAYEQEINILQQLDHPGIPKYLDSIETENGFCLIQEYISASSLHNYRPLTIPEVKQIALDILDILIYLQQQTPPILHRDIQPDNILLDRELNIHLIDFGFASLGSKEVSGSSVFKGTPGFIAPEQIIKPTLSSDLYSLGVTLICLLSHKNIAEIRALTTADNPYQLNFQPFLPNLNQDFINWLEKMTDPKASQRFVNAAIAKEALLLIDPTESSTTAIEPTKIQEINQNNNTIALPVVLGTVTIASLSTIATWGIKFIDHDLASHLTNIAIAIVAGIVIGISQLGAVTIAKIDSQARIQGGILATSTPILLVVASAFIWGRGEAVDIAGMTAIAELFTFVYFWCQIPVIKSKSIQLKSSFLLIAITLGITLGLQLT